MPPTAKKLDPVDFAFESAPEVDADDMTPEQIETLKANLRNDPPDADGPSVTRDEVMERARKHFGAG